MIKEIYFKNTKDFSSPLIKVDFSKHTNVIIGPKGGGKSTLFDLIACLKNNSISDNVSKALETYNLKFEKAIKFSNEEIIASQLSKISKKDKEESYRNRYDVIYQDDQIKKDLTNTKDIDTNKFNYLKKQIDLSHNVSKLILEIKNLWISMNKIIQYFNNEIVDINWSNTFKMNDVINKDVLSLITKIDYKPNNLKLTIEEELNEYKNYFMAIEEYNNKLNRLKISNKDHIIYDQDYNEKINHYIDLIISENKKLFNLVNERKLLLDKISSSTKIFLNSYRKLMNKIKAEHYSSSGLKSYEIKAKNHFKNLAHDLYKTINNFEKIVTSDLYLTIDNDQQQDQSLIYKIEENLKLDEDTKFEILKTVFSSPGNTRDDIGKWLKSLMEKGLKDFNEEKIKNTLSRQLKDFVKVFVIFNNEIKDYESLSLGQKSIYGLKYKFAKSIKENLYLDQPEDNLDNNTIAQEILPMLEEKRDNQIFIVTHNANIGILSNPEKVIIADLNNEHNPYQVADLTDLINDQSAHFLEGGKKYLKQRYQKIIENKGEKNESRN